MDNLQMCNNIEEYLRLEKQIKSNKDEVRRIDEMMRTQFNQTYEELQGDLQANEKQREELGLKCQSLRTTIEMLNGEFPE